MNQEERLIMEQFIKAQSYAAQTHSKIKGKPMSDFEIEQFELTLETTYHSAFQHGVESQTLTNVLVNQN